MGSYCSLRFDDWDVCSFKSGVPDEFCALFQEGDRVVFTSKVVDEGDEETVRTIAYQASREVILNRLTLLGCAEAVADERFAEWLETERKEYQGYVSEGEDWAVETAAALQLLTQKEWRERIPQLLAHQYELGEPRDEIDRRMRDADEGWLWFDGYGSLISIRALLDACPEVKMVTLDISDLVDGGWIDEKEAICASRRAMGRLEFKPLAPTVVLAEGSSDIRILERSLAALFPERQDYFSFFNHGDLSVDGGASYLVKFLKAFAAARAPFRIIAVFDNDAIGLQAFQHAEALNLPDNMVVLRLPDIEIAREYPTVGPQGHHITNVNGQAASIELYLGRVALSTGGKLRPVRWGGYVAPVRAYQGEIEGKDSVESIFLQQLGYFSNPSEARAAHPELVSIWTMIFDAVARSATQKSRSKPRR
jgi:HEPN/Toprim N-terminal domain 1